MGIQDKARRSKIEGMFRPETWTVIEAELLRGEEAQAAGFAGRARVCARRAAGAAIREFLRLRGEQLAEASAYDLLVDFADRADLPLEIRQAASRLTERVDKAFALPEEIHLLAEARRLALALEEQLSK